MIDHILRHGYVTTEELRDLYGYNHPPRGARDVREQGIPLETSGLLVPEGDVLGHTGSAILRGQRSAQLTGRTALSARIKESLIERFGARCNIYLEPFSERDLQVDHRVPFEIAGEGTLSDSPDGYMLLCPSANRAKSWSCEHCENWRARDISVCRSCYWASLESYSHVAMRDIRRLDIIWTGDESSEYEDLSREASRANQELPEFVKSVIRHHLGSA